MTEPPQERRRGEGAQQESQAVEGEGPHVIHPQAAGRRSPAQMAAAIDDVMLNASGIIPQEFSAALGPRRSRYLREGAFVVSHLLPGEAGSAAGQLGERGSRARRSRLPPKESRSPELLLGGDGGTIPGARIGAWWNGQYG